MPPPGFRRDPVGNAPVTRFILDLDRHLLSRQVLDRAGERQRMTHGIVPGRELTDQLGVSAQGPLTMGRGIKGNVEDRALQG